jgi:hypothetical protein
MRVTIPSRENCGSVRRVNHDKRAIVSVTSYAQRAADFLLDCSNPPPLWLKQWLSPMCTFKAFLRKGPF